MICHTLPKDRNEAVKHMAYLTQPYTVKELMPLGNHGIDIERFDYAIYVLGIVVPERRQMTASQAFETVLKKLGKRYTPIFGKYVNNMMIHLLIMYGDKWFIEPNEPEYARIQKWVERY